MTDQSVSTESHLFLALMDKARTGTDEQIIRALSIFTFTGFDFPPPQPPPVAAAPPPPKKPKPEYDGGKDAFIAKYPETFSRVRRFLNDKGHVTVGEVIAYFDNVLGLPPFVACNRDEARLWVGRLATRNAMRLEPPCKPRLITLETVIWTKEAWRSQYEEKNGK